MTTPYRTARNVHVNCKYRLIMPYFDENYDCDDYCEVTGKIIAKLYSKCDCGRYEYDE